MKILLLLIALISTAAAAPIKEGRYSGSLVLKRNNSAGRAAASSIRVVAQYAAGGLDLTSAPIIDGTLTGHRIGYEFAFAVDGSGGCLVAPVAEDGTRGAYTQAQWKMNGNILTITISWGDIYPGSTTTFVLSWIGKN